MRPLAGISVLLSALVAVALCATSLTTAQGEDGNVATLRTEWEKRAETNPNEVPLPLGKDQNTIVEIESPVPEPAVEYVPPPQPKRPAGNSNQPQVTATLVAWISSQSEGIIEEMEAIVKQNAESSTFSVANYLRYLSLYDSLKVIAAKPYDELKWISRKAKAFSKVYNSAIEIVFNYLQDLDTRMVRIESNEPQSKQVEVSDAWTELYESIRYIATHAPRNSRLAKTAAEMLQVSPYNQSDRKRSTRYHLRTNAFSR